jgi:nucleoid DNA-binding protein
MARKAAKRKTVTVKKTSPAKAVAKARPARSIKVTATAGKSVTAGALLQTFADYAGISKADAKAFVEVYTAVVKAYVLKGAKVKIGNVGMITIRHRKARMGRNPQTGEPVKIKASKKLAFRQSAVMKAHVAGGRGGTHGSGDGPHGSGDGPGGTSGGLR